MSLKRNYWDKNKECCLICMYIDEYAMNVSDDGEVPHGYDGIAECCIYNDNKNIDDDNQRFISPLWNPCKKYKKCTERQADYLDVYDPKEGIIENPNDISKIT